MTDLERIEAKLDRLLFLLGDGKGKLPSEIRREAKVKNQPPDLTAGEFNRSE